VHIALVRSNEVEGDRLEKECSVDDGGNGGPVEGLGEAPDAQDGRSQVLLDDFEGMAAVQVEEVATLIVVPVGVGNEAHGFSAGFAVAIGCLVEVFSFGVHFAGTYGAYKQN
jgi:hypothetical protein